MTKPIKSRSNRCGACPLKGERRGGGPGTPHCKSVRLCDFFDVSVIDRFPGRTVREYVEMQRRAEAGYAHAQQYLSHAARSICTEDDFLGFVRHVHQTIFHAAWGDIAGRFRVDGEEVSVGHEKHEFDGAPASEIESKMRALWVKTPFPKQADPDRLAYWAAQMTQEFFAIHPFVDGNGRTGRFLVEVGAHAVGLRVAAPTFVTRAKQTADRNEYLQALQYVHQHRGRTRAHYGFSAREVQEPCRPLARWWSKRIVREALVPAEVFDQGLEQEDDSWFEESDRDVDAAYVERLKADLVREQTTRSVERLDERTLAVVLPLPEHPRR